MVEWVRHRLPRSWIAARCDRRKKVEHVQAMMAPNGVADPKSIWQSIRWVICSPCISPQPVNKTGHKWIGWPRQSRKRPGIPLRLPLSIRAIRAKPPQFSHKSMASSFWWSSTPKQKEALYCCRAAGWSSVVSDGPHAFAGSHATMSAWLIHWPACIMSHSSVSCSAEQSPCSSGS